MIGSLNSPPTARCHRHVCMPSRYSVGWGWRVGLQVCRTEYCLVSSPTRTRIYDAPGYLLPRRLVCKLKQDHAFGTRIPLSDSLLVSVCPSLTPISERVSGWLNMLTKPKV